MLLGIGIIFAWNSQNPESHGHTISEFDGNFTGPQGPVGEQGPIGDKGPTGDKGPIGDSAVQPSPNLCYANVGGVSRKFSPGGQCTTTGYCTGTQRVCTCLSTGGWSCNTISTDCGYDIYCSGI